MTCPEHVEVREARGALEHDGGPAERRGDLLIAGIDVLLVDLVALAFRFEERHFISAREHEGRVDGPLDHAAE